MLSRKVLSIALAFFVSLFPNFLNSQLDNRYCNGTRSSEIHELPNLTEENVLIAGRLASFEAPCTNAADRSRNSANISQGAKELHKANETGLTFETTEGFRKEDRVAELKTLTNDDSADGQHMSAPEKLRNDDKSKHVHQPRGIEQAEGIRNFNDVGQPRNYREIEDVSNKPNQNATKDTNIMDSRVTAADRDIEIFEAGSNDTVSFDESARDELRLTEVSESIEDTQIQTDTNNRSSSLPHKLRGPPSYAVPPDDAEESEETLSPYLYESDFPPAVITTGSFSVCYVKTEKDMYKRCRRGVKWGTGVYVPALMFVGRKLSENGERKSVYRMHEPSWYSTIKQIKTETNLTVFGHIFEMDNLVEMFDNLVHQHFDVFDGFLIDWQTQRNACITMMPQLNTTLEVRHFVGNQDKRMCQHEFSADDFFSSQFYARKSRQGITGETLPMVPIFPCFKGTEGFCFKMFSQRPDESCNGDRQRFMFSPWERSSGSMWFLLNSACQGVNMTTPPYDFVQVI